jgi:microcystin-dependent protein
MVPYSIVAAAGTAILSNFDASGAGIGEWDRIFLCNGENGTPDLRGRVIVGTNDGSMLGGAMDAAVAPSATNPTYGIGSTHGNNSVVLTTGQIPAHSHSVIDPGHDHTFPARNGTVVGDYIQNAGGGAPNDDTKQIQSTASPNNDTSSSTTNISIDLTGGGQGHQNYQPGRGVFYIIYIP